MKGGERKSVRAARVAGFVLKPPFCQTCARASAAAAPKPSLRRVSALAERRAQADGQRDAVGHTRTPDEPPSPPPPQSAHPAPLLSSMDSARPRRN
ncbi:hypothetical protein OJAV_G00229870 [Oryzias javanicus]|uniref:Uncharacterized protein n=1 Tax=Oryzias javanicus TaxID=123683 RepID=A0A3S2MBI3_ORYJA|nr:hypothetical protein OJAV_G00229870 [Oryzias javanicus]